MASVEPERKAAATRGRHTGAAERSRAPEPRASAGRASAGRSSAGRTSAVRADRASEDRAAGGRERRARRASAPVAMKQAAAQLEEMLGSTALSVSTLQPLDEGWIADVEIVEVERVPDTASVMARYRVTLDSAGDLLGYEQTRRYARGQIDRDRA